jgi:hypothetical protein
VPARPFRHHSHERNVHTGLGVQAMGVRNRQRRAVKAKDRQRRARERVAHGTFDDGRSDVGEATRALWGA